MFVISCKDGYVNTKGGINLVERLSKATKFPDYDGASKKIEKMPPSFRGYKWKIVDIENLGKQDVVLATNEIVEAVYLISDKLADLPTNAARIKKEIRQIEFEIMDVEHRIELFPMSAVAGYKLAKQIKDLRKKRRVLKDEILKIQYLTQFMKTQKIIAEIEDLDNRKYNPRVLERALFKGSQEKINESDFFSI